MLHAKLDSQALYRHLSEILHAAARLNQGAGMNFV
jgi:hypothetical protein